MVRTVVVAVAVTGAGERKVPGFDVGPSEDGGFRLQFPRRLVVRSLRGVRLVIGDCHRALRDAIAAMLTGAGWQRCRVHVLRTALSYVPKGATAEVILKYWGFSSVSSG